MTEQNAEKVAAYEEYVVRFVGQRVIVEGPSDLHVEMDRPDPVASDLASALIEVLRRRTPEKGQA